MRRDIVLLSSQRLPEREGLPRARTRESRQTHLRGAGLMSTLVCYAGMIFGWFAVTLAERYWGSQSGSP